MTSDMNGYPLEGLKVLDFSRVLAGPFAGRMLADLGADVVKVEPPDRDSTRFWGRTIGGVSSFYAFANAGKRNISIDLRAPGAKDLVFALARTADVVIENFRPDVMDRLGVGYAALSAVNPRLVMLSISGFGHNGPESHRPAYAPIVHAELGLIERAAQRSGIRQDLPLSVADTNAGLHGLVGLLSALLMRARTGQGQHIDIAMMDATFATDDQAHFEIEDAEHLRTLPPDVWETGAGPILISADFRYMWRLMGETFHVEDPFQPDMDLETKIAARRGAVTDFLRTLTTWDQVESAMDRMNLAWGRVRRGATLAQQPTLQARGAIVEIDHGEGGVRPIAQSPYRFSAAQSGVRGPAPARGAHNQEVLRAWIGASDADIESWRTSGALSADDGSEGR
ncbi:MAG: hypothetical protein GC189_01345 [Alphaproteobacteria bacterium]|nr:hypothetical protein [Alphaproteobacteria bacterium]